MSRHTRHRRRSPSDVASVHTVGPVVDPAPHVRLVYSQIAEFLRRFPMHAPSHDDVTSEGFAALVRAAWGFRPALGYQFSTYAVTAIRRALWTWSADQWRRRQRSLGPAGPVQVYDEFTLDDVTPLDTDRGDEFWRERAIDEQRARADVAELVATLPPREQAIVRMRMAGETLRTVATALGLSKERIRQLHDRALRRMAGKPTETKFLRTERRRPCKWCGSMGRGRHASGCKEQAKATASTAAACGRKVKVSA